MSDTSDYWDDESASNWFHSLEQVIMSPDETSIIMSPGARIYWFPSDVIISREYKAVLRSQRRKELLNDFQQYLLYQEYQTDIDVSDNTDIDDDSSDDSVPPLVNIDNDDDSSDDSLPPLVNID